MHNFIYKHIQNGMDHKDWYTTEAHRLMELFPEFAGLPIIRCFAVTSMKTSIEANVHLAIKALLQIKRNEPVKGFLPAQALYLNLIRQGMDVPGRKIMSFINALEGDKNAVVVDMWMCRAFNLEVKREWKNSIIDKAPSKAVYDEIEWKCRLIAAHNGWEARQVQSMIWAGIKRERGISKNVSWSDLIIKKRGIFHYE